MADRQEFSPKTKTLAFERAKGRCESCGRKLFPGDAEYDHIKTAYHGGDNSLDNCACLCTGCHALKTKDHNSNASPISIPKSRRQRAITAGARRKAKSRFQTNRDGPYKAKIGGGVERR